MDILLSCIGPVLAALITAVIGPLVVAAVKRRESIPTGPNNIPNDPNAVNSNVPALAITSVVLGVFNLCSWYFPICGLPMSTLGLIFGVSSMNSSKRALAIAGIALSALGLIANVANAAPICFI